MSERPWPRIILAIPCERFMYTEAVHSLMTIVHQGFPFIAHGYARLDRTRNDFARTFLDSDMTHLLMLDSDHLHPSDIVQRLGSVVAQNPEIQVVGGLNFRRGEPYDPCAYCWDDNGNICPIHDWPDNACVKVDVLGSGSILIAREVFETLPFPWFGYDYTYAEKLDWPECGLPALDSMQWPGTDIWFSRLCNQYGIKQWVYTGVSSPHLIHANVTQGVRDAFIRKAEAHGKILTVQKPTEARLAMKGDTECQDDSNGNGASSGRDGSHSPSEGQSRASVVYLPPI